MASRAISGKPGGGKSYYATKLILDELLSTDRTIVTNLCLNELGIIEYLAKKGREDIDVCSRIVRLDIPPENEDKNVRSFWRFRSGGVVLPDISDDEIKRGIRPEISSFGDGVLYVIDETHKFLNSREWKNTGPILLWYVSQHRHFGDDIIWVTQHIPNVDKQWRSVTQDYTYLRNMSKEKWRGFTKGSKFRAETYLEPFTGQQQLAESQELTPDWKGIGSCYSTSIAGGQADKGKRVKGLDFRFLIGGVVVLALLLMLGFVYLPPILAKRVGEKSEREAVDLRERIAPAIPPEIRSRPPATATAPNSDSRSMSVVPLDFVAPSDIDIIGELENVKIVPSPRGDSVLISGSDAAVSQITAAVSAVDLPRQTVHVQAVVGRFSQSSGSSLGLWDLLTSQSRLSDLLSGSMLDVGTGLLTFGGSLEARILIETLNSFRTSKGAFSIVSRPFFSTLSGKEARISAGRDVPLPVLQRDGFSSTSSVQFRKAELSLKVLPTVLPDGRIHLTIEQENSDVIGYEKIGGDQVPVFSVQNLTSVLELKDNQVAILGGVTSQTESHSRSGVPILGQIPVLDLVFGGREKSSEKTQLVIFLWLSTESSLPGSTVTPRIEKAIPL